MPKGFVSCSSETRRPEARTETVPSIAKSDGITKPVTVLIVEDSRIVLGRLADLIAELSDVVVIGKATDGFQAQSLFTQHRPDVVVLDIQLPVMSGLELLLRFKKEHPACVVLVLTTYAFEQLRQRCAALGADYVLDKGTEFERVIEVLSAMRARRGLQAGMVENPHPK